MRFDSERFKARARAGGVSPGHVRVLADLNPNGKVSNLDARARRALEGAVKAAWVGSEPISLSDSVLRQAVEAARLVVDEAVGAQPSQEIPPTRSGASDYYERLGVDRTASDTTIARAFKRLARRWHPDNPQGDPAKFKRYGEARDILSDPEKRRAYDLRTGRAASPPPPAAQTPAPQPPPKPVDLASMDLFVIAALAESGDIEFIERYLNGYAYDHESMAEFLESVLPRMDWKAVEEHQAAELRELLLRVRGTLQELNRAEVEIALASNDLVTAASKVTGAADEAYFLGWLPLIGKRFERKLEKAQAAQRAADDRCLKQRHNREAIAGRIASGLARDLATLRPEAEIVRGLKGAGITAKELKAYLDTNDYYRNRDHRKVNDALFEATQVAWPRVFVAPELKEIMLRVQRQLN
ncbi:MAG: DnaJ domain-containing protein [Myxococcaceae bacterium]